MKKFVIVGGKGYIGAKLLGSIPEGFIALGTTSSTSKGFHQLRIEEDLDCTNLPVDAGDVVFMTAAISAPDVCSRHYDRAWSVNVAGTSTFIKGVIERGARVIFFSSDAVYGEREEAFDDLAACNPAGEYAQMKREVEERFAGDVSFKSIRLSYVFSRDDKFSRYLSGCAKRNEEAELFHPFFRAIVHREDVIEGALALAIRWNEVPEQIINFGGPQVLSRLEFAECLREVSLNELRFKVTEPEIDFFKNRPRIIAMHSPAFARLLARQPRTLCEAARLEFSSFPNMELRYG